MRPFFIIQTSDRICSFSLFKPIILQFFTILHDKLRSFNIQDDQSTRFLCTTIYSIDYIIKRFHELNSIMPGLFSQKNLVQCDMQGNNYGLLLKKIKKNSQNHLFGQPDGFSLFTGTKFAVQLHVIELPFTLQHDREFVMFRFYFPLIIKLFMVLLCVIFKSE